ncbi:uncharacterized protein LOC122023058 [Zingiber officinale]|uniref:uncharacterized protein LOC122023058 n=1 Tax=Zingiber officinale TaxID=94328 RepID=UPI001C4DA139|nr:uncharacterized protein LOC122023058 [Zingiber officinale]
MTEEETIPIEFDEAMFGRNVSTSLLREDIMRCMEMREIGSRQILVYMGYLYKYLKETNRAEYVSFVDPNKIPAAQDGSTSSQHIANQLKASNGDSICLIPYNTGGVRTYLCMRGNPKRPTFKQLTGNLKQQGCVECGYCVMRYMKEIVECEDLQLERKFAGCVKNQYYTQTQYDDVRIEWSEFVYSYLK